MEIASKNHLRYSYELIRLKTVNNQRNKKGAKKGALLVPDLEDYLN
jgi:hypothetical protein